MGVVPAPHPPGGDRGPWPGSVLTRFVRSSAIEALGETTRTADAKGLPARLVLRLPLRNALVLVVTVAGIQLAYLLGGRHRGGLHLKASACSPSRR